MRRLKPRNLVLDRNCFFQKVSEHRMINDGFDFPGKQPVTRDGCLSQREEAMLSGEAMTCGSLIGRMVEANSVAT